MERDEGMKPDLRRLFIGPAGLLIGFLIYPQIMKLPEPQQHWAVGAVFALLGIGAGLYGRNIGERWVQVLGVALILYGLLRALVLR